MKQFDARWTVPVKERFMRNVVKTGRCWFWRNHIGNRGYGQFKFRGATWLAHRVSYIINKGEIPEDMVIMHQCDNQICVNPKHLKLGTVQDNVNDRVAKGRSAIGVCNGRAKLTEEDVRVIRQLWRSGGNRGEMAKIYGVDRKTICAIVENRTWRHI